MEHSQRHGSDCGMRGGVGGGSWQAHPLQNVSDQERTYSLLGAGALLLSGLRHLSLGRLAVGGYLAYRGATGHCPVREQLENLGVLGGGCGAAMRGRSEAGASAGGGMETFGRPHEDIWRADRPRDEVEEASMESFPASDPPNYTRTANS